MTLRIKDIFRRNKKGSKDFFEKKQGDEDFLLKKGGGDVFSEK